MLSSFIIQHGIIGYWPNFPAQTSLCCSGFFYLIIVYHVYGCCSPMGVGPEFEKSLFLCFFVSPWFFYELYFFLACISFLKKIHSLFSPFSIPVAIQRMLYALRTTPCQGSWFLKKRLSSNLTFSGFVRTGS